MTATEFYKHVATGKCRPVSRIQDERKERAGWRIAEGAPDDEEHRLPPFTGLGWHGGLMTGAAK